MSFLSLGRSLIASAAVLAATAMPIVAHANNDNGQLCAVQTGNQQVVISVYRGISNPGPADYATGAQRAEGYTWCADKATEHGWIGNGGWYAASREYDYYFGQNLVCTLSAPGWQTQYRVYTTPDAWSFGVQTCNGLVIDPSSLTWN